MGPRARILVAAWLALSFPRAGLAATLIKPSGGFMLAMASRLESVEKGAGQGVPIATAVNVGGTSGGGDPVPDPDPLTSLKLDDGLQATILLADAVTEGAAGSGAASGGGAPSRAPEKKKTAKWGLPPFRLWGNLANYTSVTKSEGTPSSLINTTQVSLSASSFIWQPWFAPVAGTVGFNYAKSKTGPSRSDSTYLTGGGSLSLLPESRFPFEASADVSDTSTGGDVVGSGYRSTRIALRQSYRPLVGNSRYNVSFDRSVLDSPDFGKDVQNALSGTASYALGAHELGIDGSIVRNRVQNSGAGSEFLNLAARHAYHPEGRWSLNNMASTSRGESHVSSGDVSQQFNQLVSTLSWTPATERPMYVIGNLRYFDSEVSAGSAGTYSTSTTSLYGGLSYEIAQNVRLSAAASYTTGSNLKLNGTIGISYASDPIKLGKFDYSWNTGVSVGSQTGSDDSSLQRSGSLGHGLSRSFELGPASSLSLRFTQSAGISEGRSNSKSLSHGMGIGWNRSLESGNLSISANASDSRSFKGDPRGQQLVNLQGNFDSPLTRYSTLSGNITLQGTRPLTVADQPGFDVSTGANISYSNQRLFDVRNLRFSSALAANTQQLADRFGGTIGATPGTRGSSWDNRIDYTLGLLSFRGSARLNRTDGRNSESFFFSVSRPFGDM